MRGALVWSLVLLGGCDLVFSERYVTDAPGAIDPADAADARPPQGCAGVRFGGAAPLDGAFQLGNIVDPSMATSAELWAVDLDMNGGELLVANRIGPEMFGSPAYPALGSGPDLDPTFSVDGLEMFLRQDGRVVHARRDAVAPAMPFGDLVEVPSLAVARGLDLSHDGLTMYYADGDQELRSATRPSSASLQFTPSATSLGEGITFPGVSPDGFELFYSGTSGIHRRTRADLGAPFEVTTDELVFDTAGDPDVSPDATEIVFTRGGDIWRATRVCP